MKKRVYASILLVVTLSGAVQSHAQETRSPIIDMHMHHNPWGPPDENEQPSDWRQAWEEAKPLMDEANVVLGLVSGSVEVAQEWQRLAPDQIIAGIIFPCDGGILANSGGRKCFKNGEVWPDVDWLRQEIEEKRIGFLGEITTQYLGLPPNDPKMDPYYALAEELDIPVLIHIGMGLPGAAYSSLDVEDVWCGEQPCAPNFRAAMSRPMLLEEILIRHPRLRICVMHAGWPMQNEMINLLYNHPQVYVDVAFLMYKDVIPRRAFHGYLQALVEHGFGKRIVWGIDGDHSDAPEVIEAIESAEFLTSEQEADIFYNNAARFLQLTEEQMSAHFNR